MGGGPDKEHLLIVLWDPEPKDLTAEIKRRFPYFDVTYYQLNAMGREGREKSQTIPKELWQSATILITLSALPARPEDAPNLKLIHLFSAGVDHYMNHPIVTDSDIAITTSSGIHGPPITEWIIMTTLVASRHYATEYEWQKQHRWGTERKMLTAGTDWVGKTVGIAGYGSIGRQAARVFSALGAHVHAYTAGPRPTPASRTDTGYIIPGTGDPDGTIPQAWYSGTSKASLHAFLASGLDALIIALPLTPATRHMFSTAEFEILGGSSAPSSASASSSSSTPQPGRKSRSCFLINVARGPLLDQPALVAALNNDILLGAALDVTDPEPLPPDDPLWDAKNVIITPHISGLGSEYAQRAYDVFMVNWARREKGERMFNLVDRRKGY
ncbi:D-isomer specific 2-hydroxyacid dehydrogenase, NAD binding domain-containing protein [Cladophialophora immunda]|nr:D-isomer specific 2-hydroxyacid dehydrogenase, NAD binding domain-containing protein [Cladophialophora immunda]